VPDARYLRAQAEMCLAMAQQISDRKDADELRAMAARYLERAAALEAGAEHARLPKSPED
jgi:hypothetical protein